MPWNLHFCKSAFPETPLSNVLEVVRQSDAPKILAVAEYAIFDSLQRIRELHVFDGTILENARLPVVVRPEYLESLAELNSLKVLTLRERALRNNLKRGRELDEF